MKYHLVSLGCAKNLVDSELVLGACDSRGWEFVNDPEEAQILLLNTCGFIQPAVEEAIDEILGLAELKENDPNKKLVVFGCLIQRYKEQLLQSLPEVDLFVGTEGITQIPELVDSLIAGDSQADKIVIPEKFLMDAKQPRVQSTPFFRAWMKITEGCDNCCSYCMIPAIRGNLRSRPITDLLDEALRLEKNGVKEISLVAQDLTAYGDDLNTSDNLVALLKELLSKTNIEWIRLLYLYPSGINDELLQLIADNPRIVRYLDIPFQHVNNRVLKAMNRPYTTEDLEALVTKIRRYIPEIALRTTFLVGFPGETEAEYQEIEKFLQDFRINHVGVFPYSNEEGSVSETFPDHCGEDVKQLRCNRLLELQQQISEDIQKKYIGTVQKVLVEGVSAETDLLLEGRTQYQAPDVDGCVYINEGSVNPGDIVDILITDAQQYDLVGGVNDDRAQ